MNVSPNTQRQESVSFISFWGWFCFSLAPPGYCGGRPEQNGSGTRLPQHKHDSDRGDRECRATSHMSLGGGGSFPLHLTRVWVAQSSFGCRGWGRLGRIADWNCACWFLKIYINANIVFFLLVISHVLKTMGGTLGLTADKIQSYELYASKVHILSSDLCQPNVSVSGTADLKGVVESALPDCEK